MRPYVTAGIALVGASVIAAAPVAPISSAAAASPSQIRAVDADVSLAASSVLNIPMNLLIDIANIPYHEMKAAEFMARSLFFSGPWMVVSSTNLWGVDPGDPSHFQSSVNFAVPFPALSGMFLDQNDSNGLGQQLWQLVAATLPVSSSCDAYSCIPGVPTSPITGMAGVDSMLWYGAMATGLLRLPLFDSWFQVSLDDLMDGYTFGPDYPGYADPSGPAYPGFGFPGTVGEDNLMPWHDVTFTLDPLRPFENWLDHLMADPSENPLQIPTLEQVGRTVQAWVASMVLAFDPITPGSPFCPGDCGFLPTELDYPGLVKMIGDFWPGNELIDEWVDAYENGTANGPTPEQIQRSIDILQQGFWSFGNPDPPASWSPGFNLSTLAPVFHKLWTDLGFDPPPLAPSEPGEGTGDADASAGNPDNAILALGKVADPKLEATESTTFALDANLAAETPKPGDTTTQTQTNPLNSLLTSAQETLDNNVSDLRDSLAGGETSTGDTASDGAPKRAAASSKPQKGGDDKPTRSSASTGSSKSDSEKAGTDEAKSDTTNSESSAATKNGTEKSTPGESGTDKAASEDSGGKPAAKTSADSE